MMRNGYMPSLGDRYAEAFDGDGAEEIQMPRHDLDGALRKALEMSLPAGATFGFRYEGDQALLVVSRPGGTREVLSAALAALGRDRPAGG
jgi:hypothetical protein